MSQLTEQEIRDLISFNIPNNTDGLITPAKVREVLNAMVPGIKGEQGDKPEHQWEGTTLKFENPDGTFGEGVDLKGDTGAIIAGYPQGPYNASTNTPTLSATPDPSLNDGAYYDVTVSGAVGFAGANFTSGTVLNVGDKLKKKGTQWYLILISSNAILLNNKTANILPYSGNVVIDTTTRKIFTTGRIFVAWNLGYIDTDPTGSGIVQASTDWDSSTNIGLHFIVFNTVNNQFGVVRFDRISTYNKNNYSTVGYIEVDSTGKVQCISDFPIIVDGQTHKPTYDTLTKYNFVDVLSFNGWISIDTNNRKISVTDNQVFIVQNGISPIAINIQASTDWDSDSVNVVNYVCYSTVDNKIKVIKFDRLSNYNLQKLYFLGIIGRGNTGKSIGKVECTIKGRYKLNGDIFNSGFDSKFQQGIIQPFGGYISIDTANRKIIVEGQVFINTNASAPISITSPSVSTDWFSSTLQGIHFVFANTRTNTIQIIRYDNAELANTNQIDYILLGTIGTDSSGKLQCHINGTYKINGLVINPYDFAFDISTLKTTTSGLQSFKNAQLQSFGGYLNIDTVNRKLWTDGRVFVTYDGGYLDTDPTGSGAVQSSTDWDSVGLQGLNFVVVNKTTKIFAIVRYTVAGNYPPSDWIYLGFIGNDVSNTKLRWCISGDYILNNEIYPIVNKTYRSFGIDELGTIDYQPFNSDYNMLIGYGQSLGFGWESHYALTTSNYPNTYMVGDRVWTNHGNNGLSVFSPLVATYSDPVGEAPIISATNSFKMLFDRLNSNISRNFVSMVGGEGGQSIEFLSKECTNGVTLSTNLYATTFAAGLNRAKTAANNEGKTISCPILFFAQGEYNYDNYITNRGLTSGSNATNDKATYKALLLTLKNNMQSDVMSILGQSKKPLFFLYQTSGTYIDRNDMSISMAQIEFAQENEDVVLVNPHYAMPDYGGGHLTANGYRWWGETIAKSLHYAINRNQKIAGIIMKNISITDNRTIEIDFQVPCMPLIFDTKTTPLQTSFGFKVLNNSVEKAISSVSIIENKVILKFSSKINTGTVEVSYAGFGRNGSGNLRDSDNWKGQYTYYNDSANFPPTYNPLDENSQPLYGKRYPCYNWAYSFYKSLNF